MQQFLSISLLLAVMYSCTAHGRTFQLNKNVMTSLVPKTDAGRQMNKNNLNLDNIVTIRTPSSAVQDWSLVCQQLCGAALGGAVCAPYCKKLPFLPLDVQLENAEEIMESKQDLICPELCGLQLGDDVCTCKNYITNDLDAYTTNVCAIICDHNNVTLAGCTPCKSDNNNDDIVSRNSPTLFQQQVVPLEATTLTTPNWNELCASLCKTGDGGSLCNCDLSPFMI